MSDKNSDAGAAEVAARLAAMAPEVVKRVEALKANKEKYVAQFKEYYAERKALEAKYEALYAGTFKERSDIINGVTDPAEAPAGAKGVPAFWLEAMQNSNVLGGFVEEHDEDALKALKDVRCEVLPDGDGFKLTFEFGENDFFTNTTLTKTFTIPEMLATLDGSDPGVSKITGCDIDWKAGKDLTKTEVKKTVRQKGKKKTVTKVEPRPSFFRFFETPDMEAEAETPEEQMAIIEQINSEIEVGFFIRSRLVANAVDWFTGEAEDDDEDDYDYDGEDDEDDEDEDEEEEEEEEEEEPAPKGKKGGKQGGNKGGKGGKKDEDDDDGAELAATLGKMKVGGGAKDGAAGGEQPECKQQ